MAVSQISLRYAMGMIMEQYKPKPEFMCVGFSKCGTTTLYEILKQHPEIYLSNIKEPWYYSRVELYQKGFEWYCKRYYKEAKTGKKIGEVNPDLTSRLVPEKLRHDFDKNLKLIFMMRNPVERLYSNFKMNLKHGIDFDRPEEHLNRSYAKGFTDYLGRNLKKEPDGTWVLKNNRQIYKFETGMYAKAIQGYLKYFPKENMKFIFLEEFIKNQEQCVRELLSFIGVNPDQPIDYFIRANEGNRKPYSVLSVRACKWMIESAWPWYLGSCPFTNDRLDGAVSELRERFYQFFTRESGDSSKMSRGCRKILEDYYREDVRKLEAITGRDLGSIWFS